MMEDWIGAVDIGGTKIRAGRVSLAGRVLESTDLPTRPETGLADGTLRIAAALESLRGHGAGRLRGIGIACTGRIDEASRTLAQNAFLPGWEGAGLAQGLEDYFQVPVAIANDVVAAAAGAARSDLAHGAAVLLYVTVSTGIGGALAVQGRVYAGAGGAHPELGHHVIDPSGPQCYCGARGCWQSLASGKALEDWYAGQAGPDRPRWSARQICSAAGEGGRLAQQAVERTGYYLGLGLSNLVTLFIPDLLVLGGGLMNSFSLFSVQIDAALKAQCGMVPLERMRLAAAPDAEFSLAGAAALWEQRQGPVQFG